MTKDSVWKSYTSQLTPVVKKKPRTGKSVSSAKLDKEPSRRAAEKAPLKIEKIVTATRLPDSVYLPLERKREKALRDGGIEIDARIDLHGLTQIEAFEALVRFMKGRAKVGHRHLLIITGKGRDGAGVLRTHLTQWLGQLPEAASILAVRPAAPQHGGDGAFYVILRKG